MSAGPAILVSALGFFAIVAQTLLFRTFLSSFEGNELAVGVFFGTWLLWVALGALAGRRFSRWACRFPVLPILYLPAFAAGHFLIFYARDLVGVASYELFPFGRMVSFSFLANAPVSFVTGFLFTVACVWWAGKAHGTVGQKSSRDAPVATVYIYETLGASAGGVAVTLLLGRGISSESSALLAAFVLSAAVACVWRQRKLRFVVPALILVVLALGGGRKWAEWNAASAWSRLLPRASFEGQFTTAQNQYLHGQRAGQFVVMGGGGVCEALPNTEHASEVVALNMAQCPSAQDVLVFGPGSLSICLRFLELPSIRHVTWLHADPEYPRKLMEILPARFRPASARFDISKDDLRILAAHSSRRYDLIVMNLPAATTLGLNRYSTMETLSLMKALLSEGGVLSMRMSGAANYLGKELAYLGAATLKTVESVFSKVVLKPGDESWLIASNSAELTETPTDLKERWASIEGAAAIYPPEGLRSLYLPGRIAFQREVYLALADTARETTLINTDRRPNAMLYSLLLMMRQLGAKDLVSRLTLWSRGGIWILAFAVVMFGVLRGVYLYRSTRPGPVAAIFDGKVLVCSTGMAGMALSIVLMFQFQSRFGSLFLHIGLLSALFMLGSFIGGGCCKQVLRRCDETGRPRGLTCVLIGGHLATLALLWALSLNAGFAAFVIFFLLAGLFTGAYFPLGANALMRGGQDVSARGAQLEIADHLGGAAGALFTGLFLLPILGAGAALFLLGLLIAINLVPLFAPARFHQGADLFDQRMRPLGYTMFGIGLCVLFASQISFALEEGKSSERLLYAAREMTGKAELDKLQANWPNGEPLSYLASKNETGENGSFVFSTGGITNNIYGYGGPLTLTVHIRNDGLLLGYRILNSNETPAYLNLLQTWRKELAGRNLALERPFDGIDGVSGATLSSRAILQIVETAGKAFCAQVLSVDVASSTLPAERRWIDKEFLCLATLVAVALILRCKPKRWLRRAWLVMVVLTAGLWLNLQYSAQHVFSLLSLNIPEVSCNSSFFLIVLAPLLTLSVGNVYCGYVCPFGALQELIGEWRPARLATDLDKSVWRYGRAIKYVLLFLLVVVFAYAREFTVLSADPLITFFSVIRDHAALWLAGSALILSIAYRRFWCRNLCPAGAFLSLLNNIRLLRKLIPPSRPAHCDLGLRNDREMDCLRCDRCYHESK